MFNKINSETIGQIHLVNFVDSRIMDPIVIEEIGRELQQLFDDHPGDNFILDLKNVEFLSSAVLNRLIVLDKYVKNKEGEMAFCNLSPAVSEVFAITKLDLLFKIYDNRDAAMDAMQ